MSSATSFDPNQSPKPNMTKITGETTPSSKALALPTWMPPHRAVNSLTW